MHIILNIINKYMYHNAYIYVVHVCMYVYIIYIDLIHPDILLKFKIIFSLVFQVLK